MVLLLSQAMSGTGYITLPQFHLGYDGSEVEPSEFRFIWFSNWYGKEQAALVEFDIGEDLAANIAQFLPSFLILVGLPFMTMRWPGWFRFWSLGNMFTLSGLCYWSGTVCLFLFRWLNIYLYIYNYSYKMSQTDGKLPVWGSFRIPNQQKPRQTRPGDGLLSAVELLAFFSSLWSSFFLIIIALI